MFTIEIPRIGSEIARDGCCGRYGDRGRGELLPCLFWLLRLYGGPRNGCGLLLWPDGWDFLRIRPVRLLWARFFQRLSSCRRLLLAVRRRRSLRSRAVCRLLGRSAGRGGLKRGSLSFFPLPCKR